MLAKGRKVAGRGGDMSAHYAFGPQEDDAIIKHRLLTRTTTTRGEPPLKKLQKKFMSFATEVEKDADNISDCERLYKAFLQEINTFELPLLKSKAVVDANLREKESFNELQDEIQRQILQAQTDIEDLKKQLEQSKIERQHKEECEAIRKMISLQPPRSETEKLIADLEKEIANLEAENTACIRTLELRKKQFALLLHVVSLFVMLLLLFWIIPFSFQCRVVQRILSYSLDLINLDGRLDDSLQASFPTIQNYV